MRFISLAVGLAVLFSSYAFAVSVDKDARYLVKLRDRLGISTAPLSIQSLGVSIEDSIPELNVLIVKPKKRDLDSRAVQQLRDSGEVEYIEKDELRWHAEELAVPTDPLFGEQYALRQVNAPQAWDLIKGSDSVVVAVTDTGVEMDHADLKKRIWTNPKEIAGNGIDDDGNGYVDDVHGWDFTNNTNNPIDGMGHGTHVAGIIGAEPNNGVGIAGVAWNVSVMPVRFMDASGAGKDSAGAEAIVYAAKNGARIINASWGAGTTSKTVEEAIKYAQSMGAVVIAAAGNDGKSIDKGHHFPSDVADISIAATSDGSGLASFSNFGLLRVHLGAPGTDVLSAYRGAWQRLSGTSMATPMVSGIAALVVAADPTLRGETLRNALLNAVNPRTSLAGKVATGGEIDAAKAVSQLSRGFQLWPGRLTLATSQAFSLTAYHASGSVQWASSDPAVATVADNGTVSALGFGDTTITGRDGTGAVSEVKLTVAQALGGSPGCAPRADASAAGPVDMAAVTNFALPLLVGFLLRRRRSTL